MASHYIILSLSSIIVLALYACGAPLEGTPSLQERFEAVYGYTDCKDVDIGTTFTQSTWMMSFHTYHGGYLQQTDTTYTDEYCKTSFTNLNRYAKFEILAPRSEETEEVRLAITTRRILTSVNENVQPGEPGINCNIEMADDLEKEECKAYLGVTRYVTVKLTDEGYQPFKDLDSAGTTEDTASTELAPHILKVLNGLDD